MEIVERIEGDVAILAVTGSLLIASEVQAFHAQVKALVEREIAKVVVDFLEVDHCGSVMLGQLTASKGSLMEKNGDIRLARMTEKFGSLLRITGLNQVFKQFASVEEAVESFGK